MAVNLIAAVGLSGQIGLNGKLPWYNKEDLKWFKDMTMNGIVIVGHKTYQELPELPGRTVIVDRRDELPADMLANIAENEDVAGKEIWIAGGAKTYSKWLPFIERFFISRINYDGPADTYMPDISLSQSQ